MSDIWSNLGTDIQTNVGTGWLYHKDGEVHGPIPLERLVDKLANGDITLKTPVAKEGGDFHPAGQVAALEAHMDTVRRGMKKRNAARMRKLLLLLGIPALAAIGVGAFFVKEEIQRKEEERLAELAKLEDEKKKEQEKIDSLLNSGQPDLVALVSLGDVSEMKVGKSSKRKPSSKSSGDAKEESDTSISSCARSTQQIYGVLAKHIARLNVCVEDEKKRDTQGLLPGTLPLEFVVTPTGKITEFGIADRHYRTGPMNNCMIKAFRLIKFPSADGSNCPVTIPIKIRG